MPKVLSYVFDLIIFIHSICYDFPPRRMEIFLFYPSSHSRRSYNEIKFREASKGSKRKKKIILLSLSCVVARGVNA